jgi:hypothetical protein
MRVVAAGALMPLVLPAVPGAGLAANPAPAWPSARDLEQHPGLLARDAVCTARYCRSSIS